MSILTDTLPVSVEIGGKSYPINSDFRVGIQFENLIMSGEENPLNLLLPFFEDNLPDDLEGAFKAIEEFYCCGKLPEKKEKPTERNTKQAYSFDLDSEVIFSDFWNFYNIDLSQEGLHWWSFRSLLFGLPEKSEFKQRAYYRTCSLKDLSKKERQRVLKIRSQIEIKAKEDEKTTLNERNAQMKAYILKRQKELAKVGE